MAGLSAAGLRAAVLLGGGGVAVAGAVGAWAVFAPTSTLVIPDNGAQVAASGGVPPSVQGTGTALQGQAASALAAPDVGIAAEPPAALTASDRTDAQASDVAPQAITAAPGITPSGGDPAEQPAAPQPPPISAAVPPAFDVVRVEPDGAALVAGRAAPGAVVGILVDGAAVAEATADADGRFVAQLDLPASPQPRLLTLRAADAAGEPVPGAERVALAPTATASVPIAAGPTDADLAANANGDAASDVPQPATLVAGTGAEAAAGLTGVNGAAAPAGAPVAILLGDDGARVLQGALSTGAEPDVSIDALAYSDTGEVLLSGRAKAGVVRLYLDNRAVQDIEVTQGAWSAQLVDTAPGLYTLRADGLAKDGTVTARFETPFKRETREALAATLGRAIPPAGLGRVADTQSIVGAATTPSTAAPAQPITAAAPGAQVLASANPVPPVPAVSVTVQPGFTLWGIAEERFGSGMLYVQVFEANRSAIRDPDLIYPGQVFALPAPD